MSLSTPNGREPICREGVRIRRRKWLMPDWAQSGNRQLTLYSGLALVGQFG